MTNYSITENTIILSSLFLGSAYMTVGSLKEINKLTYDIHSVQFKFINVTLSWSIFGLSSIILLTSSVDMCRIMEKSLEKSLE